MRYIVCRRYRGKTIAGKTVNLPYGTVCERIGNIVFCKGEPFALATSMNAHYYLARDDDGNGEERGKLIREILNTKSQKAWDRIVSDGTLRKYKRTEHDDRWLWNHEFFNAEIEEIRKIRKIIREA